MKKILRKTLNLTIIFIALTYRYAYASGLSTLQNFLNGYVVAAGQIVCIIGAVQVCISLASNSTDKKINGLRLFLTGLVMTSANNIINSILK